MAKKSKKKSKKTTIKAAGERKLFQHGDVLIFTGDIPADVVPAKDNILAEGEATGHMHRLSGSDVEVLQLGDKLFARVRSGDAKVTHEEHDTIALPPGDYQIGRVQEFDHFAEEARNVAD